MTNERILEVIASTPQCRVAQIVDKLDMEFEDVQASLAALEAVGDIVSREETGPNGLQGKAYSVSEKFKQTDAYKRMTLKASSVINMTPGMNRVERAIAFVREHGTATSSELHALMGLADDEYASNALASAVRTKRLIKDGKNWTLGPGPGGGVELPASTNTRSPAQARTPARTVTPAAFPMPKFLSKATQPDEDVALAPGKPDQASTIAADVMASVVASAKAASAPTPAKPARPKAEPETADTVVAATPATSSASAIRCGLWSDGHVEVQRDGQTAAVLAVEEVICLADFWARIAKSAKEVS